MKPFFYFKLLLLILVSSSADASFIFKKKAGMPSDSLSIVRYKPELYFKGSNKTNTQYVVRYLVFSSERINKKNIGFYVNDKLVDLQNYKEKKNSHWQRIDYYRSYFTYIINANDIESAYKTKLCINSSTQNKCSDKTSIENLSGKPQLNMIALSANNNNALNKSASQFKSMFDYLTIKNEMHRHVTLNASAVDNMSVQDINQIADEIIKNFKQKERPLKQDILVFYLSARPYDYFISKQKSLCGLLNRSKYKNTFSVNELTRKLAKLPCRSILITDVPRQENNKGLNFQHKVTVLSYTAPKSQRNDGTTDREANGTNYLHEAIADALTIKGDKNTDGKIEKNEFVKYINSKLKCGKKGTLITTNYTENYPLFSIK
jgi:hypothetical protein